MRRRGIEKLTELLRVSANLSETDDLEGRETTRGESEDDANDDDGGKSVTGHPSVHRELGRRREERERRRQEDEVSGDLKDGLG